MLYVASDNLIWLLGLVDNSPSGAGAFVTAATVSAQIQTISGTNVGSPITMAYQAGSVTLALPNGQSVTSAGGNYWGQSPYSVGLTEGTTYNILVTAGVGSNQRTFRAQFTAGFTGN